MSGVSEGNGTLANQFTAARQQLSKLPHEPSNADKLTLYGLYKQSTEGGSGPKGDRPGFLDPVGRAKWDSWAQVKDLDKESAIQKYVELVTRLNGGPLPEHQPLVPSSVVSKSPSASQVQGEDELTRLAFPRKPGTVDSLALETIVTSLSPKGVLTARLNRPRRGNSLNMAMWRDLNSLFTAIKRDSGVRCVILTGDERNFSTGMDLSVFVEMQKVSQMESCEGRRRESLLQIIEYLQESVSLAENCHVPVLACVSGPCIGGAIDIITACDMRFCTKTASFSVKEIDLAIPADIGTLQRLPRLIPEQVARDLAFTGRQFDAAEAWDIGLVLKPPFDSETEMLDFVTAKAEEIATKSPLTVRGVKRSLNYSRDHSVAEGLQHIRMHNAAFLYSNDLIQVMGNVGGGVTAFKGT